MNIMIFLIFVSFIFVAGFVLFFAFTIKNRDVDYMDSMSLMPLAEESHGKENNNV